MLALLVAASAVLGGCANATTGTGATGASEESPRPAPRYTRLPVR